MSGQVGPASGERELRRALVVLCLTEITSWGVLYYAFPVMLSSVTRTTGWSTQTALGAYSTGLLTSAAVAPLVGRLLGRYGPRPVMTVGSGLGVVAVLVVASARALPWFFAGWVLVGFAEAALLYPPAFAALTHWYGARRVSAITVLSLVGGLASTVFAPATSALLQVLDWRHTYVVLAVALGVITLPLHAFGLTPAWRRGTHPAGPTGAAQRRERPAGILTSRSFLLLVLAMSLGAFGLFGATLNLVPLMTDRGVSNPLAATALGLVGVGQVLGRLGYPTLTRRTEAHTRASVVLVIGALSVAVLGSLSGPVWVQIAVAVCTGAIRGTYTLLQATAVSDRWGTAHYAVLNGVAIAPATAAMAVAPAGTALLVGALHSYSTAYLVLGALVLLGGALAFGSRSRV